MEPDIRKMLQIVVEAQNEKTVVATMELIASLEKRFYRNGKHSLKTINDKSFTAMNLFPMRPIHCFFEEFHLNIHRFIEAGIPLHKHHLYDTLSNSWYDEEVPPLVLTMDDLEVGFITCLIPLAVSVIVFLVEVTIPLIKKIWDAVTASFVVVSYVRSKIV